MSKQRNTEQPCGGRHKVYLRRALEALVLVGILVGVHQCQTRAVVRGPAPGFSAQLLDGRPVALADYSGRPVLLYFWATWCPVCRLERGAVESLAGTHQVLTVSLDQMKAGELRHWLDQRGVGFPVVQDRSGRIARQYGIKGVPSSIVIDGAGNVRFVEVGYTTQIGLRLRLWWAGSKVL
jgi:peroxiredoxin